MPKFMSGSIRHDDVADGSEGWKQWFSWRQTQRWWQRCKWMLGVAGIESEEAFRRQWQAEVGSGEWPHRKSGQWSGFVYGGTSKLSWWSATAAVAGKNFGQKLGNAGCGIGGGWPTGPVRVPVSRVDDGGNVGGDIARNWVIGRQQWLESEILAPSWHNNHDGGENDWSKIGITITCNSSHDSRESCWSVCTS